jgi:allantoinase
MTQPPDLIVKNAMVIRHDQPDPAVLDLGIADGRFVRIEPGIPVTGAARVIDARRRLAYPGVIDAHQHWGIYNPLNEDARSESRACAQGGVTTGLTYIRTGQYYLNECSPYDEFFPKVLDLAAGRSYVDYAFHVAPMMNAHIDEIPLLISKYGVTSFKIFMFYGGYGLHGPSADQRRFLMTPEGEHYDVAHFEFVMRGVQEARRQMAEMAGDISLSLHCETAEIMRAYTDIVRKEGTLSGLEAYSASRPPHSEGLAIAVASYLAHETDLANINLLHLSSATAIRTALVMAGAFPHIDFRREVTIGHLLADFHSASGLGGKVNPPLRSREDVEALWDHVLAGDIDWVVSDHACCREETKFGEPRDDVFLAKAGFGGAEYLLPGLISEGRKRGLSHQQIARLTSWNPAQRFGLHSKGAIAEGYDADFCLVDPAHSWVIRAADSESEQEYTPFEGVELSAQVTDTFVRGSQVLADGKITGEPAGQYLRRPTQPAAGA